VAYPRRCPLCGVDYSVSGMPNVYHVTVGAEPGGTPRPHRVQEAGRLLTLRCLACDGAYTWDYFAGAVPAEVAGGPPRRPVRAARTARSAMRLRGTRHAAAG
jgi:hypothetical protein